MSTRPVQDLLSPPRAAADHELRIQLEGAWEVLEQARMRQDALLKPLASRRWRKYLRRKPELLRQVRELQAPLAEALERARHRLEAGAPEDSALRLLLRQVWAQRTRLEALVLERLDADDERGTSFTQALERLEERGREPYPLRPHEGEHVLLDNQTSKWVWGLFAAYYLYELVRAVYGASTGSPGRSWKEFLFVIASQLLTIHALLLYRAFREGRRLLTSRRLVFKPLLGKPRQFPLDSILAHDGITPVHENTIWSEVNTLTIRSGDPKPLILWGKGNLGHLYALLELHRRPPLFGHIVGPPTYPLALLAATRHPAAVSPEHVPEPGMLVLRPGQVAFLPTRGLDAIIKALFETFPSPPPDS